MKGILRILILFSVIFSSFIICMQEPEVTGVKLELFKAIEEGKAERVQQLIDEGVDFTESQMYRGKIIFPMVLAQQKGKQEIISIIAREENYTIQQRFLAAIKKGNIDKIKKVIINGRIGDSGVAWSQDDAGNTAIILAVQKNNLPLVQQLLLWKADINIQNVQGESALTLALKLKNKPIIVALLEKAFKIAIDLPDRDGNTPLILAIQNGDLEIIKKVAAEIPNPDEKNLKKETAYNFIKDTPDKQKIIELLEKTKKQYALYKAINEVDVDIIRNSDASLDISSAERNPLISAMYEIDTTKLLEEIIAKGANVNQILRGNRTPLWIASDRNSNISKLLLEKGAKPDIATDIYDDYTPIFLALQSAIRDKIKIVQYLIDYKANVNYQASSTFPRKPGNVTPLMLAVETDPDGDIVKILLAAGANPLMKNSEGKTALDIAQEKEKTSYAGIRKSYQKIVTILKNSTWISLLQNFTQQLRVLQKMLINL